MRAQLADWWQATDRHPQQESVLLALQRSSVAELNANAHALMRHAGRLGDDEITVADRSFAAGDRVVLLRNNKTLDVDNGDRGIVVDVDADRRALTVELDAGRNVRLPDWYLDAGWVDHGYALTAHKLQSTTVDRTFALASDGLYQEASYSIATRARHETHFYLADQPGSSDHEQAHGPPQPPKTPSPALPATSAPAAPKPSPQTSPPTRAGGTVSAALVSADMVGSFRCGLPGQSYPPAPRAQGETRRAARGDTPGGLWDAQAHRRSG